MLDLGLSWQQVVALVAALPVLVFLLLGAWAYLRPRPETPYDLIGS